MNPKVNLDGIGFEVNTVSPTAINGNVQRAGPEFRACVRCGAGQQPCKFIHVRNPGGRNRDTAHSVVALYTLLGGPPPFPQSRFPDSGFSIGGTVITIKGENLDFVDNVTVGGTDAPIIAKTDRTLIVSTLPHSASGASSNPITLFDIDCAAPSGTAVPGGGFRYDLTPVTDQFRSSVYVVGPGEGVFVKDPPSFNTTGVACVSGVAVVINSALLPPGALQGTLAFTADGQYQDCGCICTLPAPPGDCPRTVDKTVTFRLGNAAATTDSRLFSKPIERTMSVRFDSPPRVCSNKSF